MIYHHIAKNLLISCYNFGNQIIETPKDVVLKIAEFVKKVFSSIFYFVAGFCVGALLVGGYIISQLPSGGIGYHVDLVEIAFFSTLGGLVLGTTAAINVWDKKAAEKTLILGATGGQKVLSKNSVRK